MAGQIGLCVIVAGCVRGVYRTGSSVPIADRSQVLAREQRLAATSTGQLLFYGVDPGRGQKQLFVAGRGGGRPRQLTHGFKAVFPFASWSPTGDLVAFAAGTTNFELYVISPAGGQPRRLTTNPQDDNEPAFSPTGAQIAFASVHGHDENIWLVNRDGSGLRQVTRGTYQDAFPAFSPDGDWIVFTSNRGGAPQLWVVHPDGTGLAQLTSDANCDATPSWSPDGTQIVFAASPITNGRCATNQNVYLLTAHGEQQITHGKLDGFPAFMPDGGLTWTSEDTPYDRIWTARRDGTHPHPLSVHTNHAAAATGRWQPIQPIS